MALEQYLDNRNDPQRESITWRKANAIHRFFIENGELYLEGDEGVGPYNVSYEILKDLLYRCERVAASLRDQKVIVTETSGLYRYRDKTTSVDGVYPETSIAKHLLPTMSGLIFGSIEYDEYYLECLERTIIDIAAILKDYTDADDWVYYSNY